MTFIIKRVWKKSPKYSFHGPHRIEPKNKTATTSDDSYSVDRQHDLKEVE